jgi:DNA-binding response OmpR family regulator
VSVHSEKNPSRDQRLRSPARALLVIDQRPLADDVERALKHGQYITLVASTGQEASSAVAGWSPHLVVLDMDMTKDVMLERFAATILIERLPVIALTQCGDLQCRLAAFEQGMDDILTVPFSPAELLARAGAVMRRTYRDAAVFSPVLRLRGLEIDLLNRRVRAGPTELRLTSLEQSLLYLLAANAGRLVTRDEILDCLWGADYVAESNIVDRHIHNLRVKLRNQARRQYIVTVPGRGYRFLLRSPDSSDRLRRQS